MNNHHRLTWTLIGGLLIVMLLGLALSSPSRAIGQSENPPTHVPPPPRTLPPGIRSTPVPQAAQKTPRPPSENLNTPTPVPVIMLPISGGSTGGADHLLSFVLIGGGLGLLALALRVARRSHTQ